MDERNKRFLEKVLKVVGWLGGLAIIIIGAVFDVKYNSQKNTGKVGDVH